MGASHHQVPLDGLTFEYMYKPGDNSGELSSLAPHPYSGERSSLAPPPYKLFVCLSVSQISTGGVGVDSNVTVCRVSVCPKNDSTGGVGVDSNVTVCLCVSQNSSGGGRCGQ